MKSSLMRLNFSPINNRQEDLAHLVLELHRIPPKPFKRWNGELFVTDSLFSESLSNRRRDEYDYSLFFQFFLLSHHSELTNLGHEISTDTTKETWISLSSCIARCIELRIESHVPDSDRYPLMEITKGLEENLSPGLEQDTRVMVAAQCIILAPTLVSDKMKKLLGGHGKPSGCDVLRLWIRKLEDLADNSGLNSELKAAVVEVRDKLVLLHPELSTGRPGEV
ncbi:hypothetical protein H103_06648 [Trichophyton rubrum CBS 288.86]|uniref:Uncharacterized protein n=1 Tax=Trichophyton rubrum CBS 288.86 TaxID=1215330 RepID=A0A022VV50_TRIRU|nr:hypothetical protein H103_06648 [Trichophyton rubrum CBS 288.86]EZG02959.1 hypothetical protein H106_06489 [Trichophyton rubrum CBS 735.88]